MSTTNISIRTDSETKKTDPPSKPAGLPFGRGCMEGKMWMADDFDAPLSLSS
ncbi:hypothetical protein R80B4_02898 [Fibrobacteres bacterium R8-0-B4]